MRGDIGDRDLVARIVCDYSVTACAHFAGKIRVGESVTDPAMYFEHNVVRTLALLEALRNRVGTFLFSSSAAVYGAPDSSPIAETAPLLPVNPYGMTKLAIEQVLAAYGEAYGLRWAALRYFNAAGAHADGSLRESHEPETHLIPLVVDATAGRRPGPTIFGDDYPTPDGTCVRDYVHVCDLASAHLAALDALSDGIAVGPRNLGTGRGYSVREVIEAAATVLGRSVPHTIGARRPGDPPVLVADGTATARLLRWRPVRTALTTVIEDTARSRLDR